MWQTLGSLLQHNLTEKALLGSVDRAMVLEMADKILKELFPRQAARLKVVAERNGVLWLSVARSIDMQELSMQKRLILQGLSSRGLTVRDVRIKFEAPDVSEPIMEEELAID